MKPLCKSVFPENVVSAFLQVSVFQIPETAYSPSLTGFSVATDKTGK